MVYVMCYVWWYDAAYWDTLGLNVNFFTFYYIIVKYYSILAKIQKIIFEKLCYDKVVL
jgi:hypothetical protein